MQWLEFLLSLEAGAEAALASLSCVWLVGLAREAQTRGRRVGAAALAIVCAGLASEAVLFLSQTPLAGSLPRSAALLVVRSALLLSAALVAALIARSNGWRR